MTTTYLNHRRAHIALLGLALSTALLGGCAPLLVGGAMVGGTLMMMDRRTTGSQVDDQAIELKASNRVRELTGDRAHVNITSYNRTVLITGEAATDADRSTIEQAVQRVENVRSIVNEVGVMVASSLTSRSSGSTDRPMMRRWMRLFVVSPSPWRRLDTLGGTPSMRDPRKPAPGWDWTSRA